MSKSSFESYSKSVPRQLEPEPEPDPDAPRGPGRPKGAKNKKQIKTLESIKGKLKLKDVKLMPLEFLLQVINDPLHEDADGDVIGWSKRDRLTAAIAAAPYCHPKQMFIKRDQLADADDELSRQIREASTRPALAQQMPKPVNEGSIDEDRAVIRVDGSQAEN